MKDIVEFMRVFPQDGHEQIVQGGKVIPSERPLEQKVEQIGGFFPQQIVEENANVVQPFGMEEVIEVRLTPRNKVRPKAECGS